MLWFLVTIFLTGVAGIVLFQPSIITSPISIIIAIGMDPLRSQFLAALLMTAASALVGAALARKKLASVIGGVIVLWFGFLNGFVQSQLQPVFDPGGVVEPLNSSILIRNALLMLNLGILSAFIGAAIGRAVGETMIDPIYYLASKLWQRWGIYSHFAQDETIPQVKTMRIRSFQTKEHFCYIGEQRLVWL